MVDSGWAVPSWPERWYGLALPPWADGVVHRELADCGAVSSVPTGVAGPTILEKGPDHVRQRFLRPLLTGEEVWCQLFSEPAAGSDLAGLTTTARLDGDAWVVNGQKVWNTGAQHADMALLIARTSWDMPKHQGITYFVLPLDQPGVRVRPIRQMNNHSSFNEVFLTDARIPREWVIGEVNEGWATALVTLAHERRFGIPATSDRSTVDAGQAAEEVEAETIKALKVYSWYPQRAGRPDLVLDHARSAGRSADPIVRQEMAKLIAMDRTSKWTAERAKINRELGRSPGPEGSIVKLATSWVARQAALVHSLIGGANGLLGSNSPTAALGGLLAEILVSVPAQSIAGGTDEIQRNILGEKVLGLPRESDVTKGLPYRHIVNR
jgi:alkylation response protein AidB-like acyl-CoA dehydrogenase